MSGTTSVQNPQEVNSVNFTQDPQKSASLHGRVFHKITDGGKYIIQSINKVAQSILSTCIYVGSFGRCDLDSLKSYFFSNQTALKDHKTASSSNSPTRPAPPPPPPPMPTSNDLNRVSSSRFSAKAQSSSFQEPTALGDLDRSSSIRSDVSFTQNASQKDDLLEDGIRSRRSSLHENSHPVIEEKGNTSPDVSPQKKSVLGGLFAGVQESKLFQKIKKKVNSE
ncbi:MAG: hypothetical protein C5B45_01130 [Chlamydiae bacterium]|nr:MAG: hypothetical protein C5B45_01130 [Chlamydiota bacterium]